MSDANTLVQQAKKAYTAGDKAKARELLLKAVDLDEHNEQAWMWMSAVVSSMEEQQICLENVLSINPNNEKARKGLEAIQKKLGKPAAPPPAASVPPAKKTDIFSGIDFNEPGNPFTTDHGWGGQAPASSAPAPASWGDIDPSVPAEPAGWGDMNADSASSGWTDSAPAVPAAYGSGKQVDQPSGAQLDDWISNMGIGSSAGTGSPSPFDTTVPAPAASDPFGGTADSGDPWANTGSNIWGSAEDDPWANPGSSAPAAPASPTPAAAIPDDPWSSVSDPFSSSRSTAKPTAPAPAPQSDVFSQGDKPYDGTITDLFAGSDPFGDSAPAASHDPFGGVSIYEEEPTPTSKPSSSKKAAVPAPVQPASFDFGSEDEFVFDEDGNFFDDDRPAKPVKAKAKAQPAKASKSAVASEFDFGDDEEGDFSDPFAEMDEQPAKRGKAAAALSPHYDLIPDELRGSGGGRGLMVAAAVLAILNLAALAGIFMAM